MKGVLRSICVAAAGVGLVVGVAYLPAPINLAPAADETPSATARAEPVTQAQAICPGPEELGVAGLPDSRTQVSSVTAVITCTPAMI